MSDAETTTRLKPEVLDRIIADLDLTEASALENLQQWYRELLRTFWNWLKAATGGDDGWLDRVSDRISDWLSQLSGGEPIDADRVLSGITWFTGLLLLVGIGYLLWRLYRSQLSVNELDTQLPDILSRADLQQPVAQLQPQQWAPALFSQVCRRLVEQGLLRLPPDATNHQLANSAQLPPDLSGQLTQMATAADRAMFGNWTPAAEDLATLTACRDAILARSATTGLDGP